MIRNIILIDVNGRFRLQGHSLTREDLILLFNLHGYTLKEDLIGWKFWKAAEDTIKKIAEDTLTQSLRDLTEMTSDDKIYYTRLAREKSALLDSLGKN